MKNLLIITMVLLSSFIMSAQATQVAYLNGTFVTMLRYNYISTDKNPEKCFVMLIIEQELVSVFIKEGQNTHYFRTDKKADFIDKEAKIYSIEYVEENTENKMTLLMEKNKATMVFENKENIVVNYFQNLD